MRSPILSFTHAALRRPFVGEPTFGRFARDFARPGFAGTTPQRSAHPRTKRVGERENRTAAASGRKEKPPALPEQSIDGESAPPSPA